MFTLNGLAEALIKRIKPIARPILQGCNLPMTCWGHAVLHAADLIQLRPTAYHTSSPLQMVRGDFPSAEIRLRCVRTDLTTQADFYRAS